MPFRFIYIVFVFNLFTSCKKEGPMFDGNCISNCIVLQGQLVEQQTRNGISNVDIGIYYKRPYDILFGQKTDYLGQCKTKMDGSYEFSFPKGAYYDGKIEFMGSIPGFINQNIEDGHNVIGRIQISIPQDTMNTELKLWRSSKLGIRVVTTSTTNFETFFFNNTFLGSYFGTYSISGNRSFDTTFNILTASDIPTYITWRTLQGTLLQGQDSIIVPTLGQGSLLIEL